MVADRRRPAKDLQLTRRGRALLADVEEIYGELEAGGPHPRPGRGGDPRRELQTVVRAAHGGALPPVRPTAGKPAPSCNDDLVTDLVKARGETA